MGLWWGSCSTGMPPPAEADCIAGNGIPDHNPGIFLILPSIRDSSESGITDHWWWCASPFLLPSPLPQGFLLPSSSFLHHPPPPPNPERIRGERRRGETGRSEVREERRRQLGLTSGKARYSL